MLDFLEGVRSVRMTVDQMSNDYRRRFAAADGHPSWKLERRQHFRDPQFASWSAFDGGDWTQAMRLLEDERPALAELQKDAAARNLPLFRVRVVEEPIVPYLQWEMYLFRLRVEYGELIRVISPELLRPYETDELVPELLTVGADAVFEFHYDDTATLVGATRYDSPTAVKRCNEFVESLYHDGEDFTEYFAREVAPLPPPRAE